MRDATEPDPLAAAALRAGSVAAREPLARAAGGASVRELVAASAYRHGAGRPRHVPRG
jgi:hypothetical protein